jgi:2-methylcitrate dehydratase PrpD
MNVMAASAGLSKPEANVDFTAHMVSEVSKIEVRNAPERVLERARHAILDWLGVTIAGAQQPSARISQHVLATEGGVGVSRVIGTPHRLTSRQAALTMGIAGHSQDFDDMGFGGHPSVAVLPAVFAVADEIDADGVVTVEAILRGFQVMSMVSAACGRSSYDRGFHTTGTFGAFGAAAGVGALLNMSEASLQQALGIAGTQAAGIKASFGTMSKHLNAGNAAAVGVLSARLAEAGFTGATGIVEDDQGFAVGHNDPSSGFDASRPEASMGERLAVEQIMFKLHAACGGTHSSIDGIRAIKAKRPFTIDEVEAVELVVSDKLPGVCGIPEPTTGVEGMFSIRYAASLALLDRTTGPSAFTDEAVRDPIAIAARENIKVIPVARIATTGKPTEVTVRLKNGEVLTACIDILVVASDDELAVQWAKLEAKFHDLVSPVLGEARSRELVDLVRRVETLGSIRELIDMTA